MIIKMARKLSPVKLFLSVPAVFLIGAYIYMVIFYNKLWLFNTIVHENGKYTLLEVILYFRHFSWEVLIKIVYSFFIVGAFYYYGRPLNSNRKVFPRSIPMRWILLSLFSVLGLIAVTVLSTTNTIGFHETMLGFLQYKTAVDRPPEFGSHWRNHFLSNITLFSTSALFVLLYRVVFCGGYWLKRKFSILLPFSLGIFISLTFFFGFTMDPFKTFSYIGHQLREIFGTDLPITMFLAMSMLIYLEKKFEVEEEDDSVIRIEMPRKKGRHFAFWFLSAFLPTGFLIMKVLTLNISKEIGRFAGTKNWTVLTIFAWHFYEHSLDYFFVVFLVSFLYLSTLKIELKRIAIEE